MVYEMDKKFVNKNLIKVLGKGKNEMYSSLKIENGVFKLSHLSCDGKCLVNNCKENLRICSLSNKDLAEFKSIIKKDLMNRLTILNMNNDDIAYILKSFNVTSLLQTKWIIGLSYDEVIKRKADYLNTEFYKDVSKVTINKDETGNNIINITTARIKQTDGLDTLYPNVNGRLFCPVHYGGDRTDKYYDLVISYRVTDNTIKEFIKENLMEVYAWAFSEILYRRKSIVGLKPSVLIKEKTHQIIVRFKKSNVTIPIVAQ